MRRSTVLLFALLASCATAPQAPAPAPALRAAGTAQRVVLVSFDGLGADELARMCRSCPAFEAMTMRVDRVLPVTPTASSSAHAAILTGQPPEVTGIVGNRFHRPGTPWTEAAQGFAEPIDAETVVETARRAGKRVVSIAFPTLDGRSPRREVEQRLAYVQPVVRSRMVNLQRSDFRAEWTPPGWTKPASRRHSFSPVMRARVEWGTAETAWQDVNLVAYDMTDDHQQNYDAIFVETSTGEIAPDARGWFAVSMRRNGSLFGSWSKLLRFDPKLESVALYWGAISRNDGAPESFVRLIDDEAGFWPAPPDEPAAARFLRGEDGIDDATFAEQAERFAMFLTNAAVVAARRVPFDFMLVYQPVVDQSLHQFLTESGAGLRVRQRAVSAADATVAGIAAELAFDRDALVVTGDHGLSPVDTELRLIALLTQLGFAPQWAVFANGNVAHLYRTAGEDNGAELRRKLEETGWFEEIVPRSARSHPNSGDLMLLSKPNVSLTMRNAPEVTARPTYTGQHGGLPSHPEFHTVLFARGAGVPALVVPQARQTDIAPFLASLLAVDRPRAIVAGE